MTALNAQENDLEIRVNLPADVLFDFDRSDIRSDAAKALSSLATIIRANPRGRTRLEGHTDAVGNAQYNQALSERRAESVRKYLVGLGADGRNIKVVSYGEERPADPGHDEAAWAKNRRAELTAGAGQ